MAKEKELKILKRIFNEIVKGSAKVDVIKENERKGYMDGADVLMFIPKTKSMKKFIESSLDVGEPKNIPSLEYHSSDKRSCSCKYSVEYLKIILSYLNATGEESVTIKMREDYPLWVETDEVIIVLAPRVSVD